MTPLDGRLGKMMGSGPTVWLATDQTETAVVYRALLRGLLPREVGLRQVTFKLVTSRASAGPWVGRLAGLVDGFDPVRDVLIIVHDWEEDREAPEANRRRREVRRNITELVQRHLGLSARQIQFFLMPPTTESLYFLLAHLGFPSVKDRLLRCDGVRDRDIVGIGVQRLAVAADPHGDAVGPSRDVLRQTLGLTGVRKTRLARSFADAIERDLGEDGLRNGLRESPALCLAYLMSLAAQLTP